MYGKIKIKSTLTVKTGMHIGGTDGFSAIGAVDSPVIKDAYSGLPIIPGSSLKGKLRTLLARSFAKDIENMPKVDDDNAIIKRLFGSANPTYRSRTQFSDCFVANADEMKAVGITEIKTENAINRQSSVANPRQIERVTAGTKFDVNIVYDIDKEAEIIEDMTLLAKGIKLLQWDYLGGHGTRGSGRVSFTDFVIEPFEVSGEQSDTDQWIKQIKSVFDGVEAYELFSVQA